jgi:hypothetical protein
MIRPPVGVVTVPWPVPRNAPVRVVCSPEMFDTLVAALGVVPPKPAPTISVGIGAGEFVPVVVVRALHPRDAFVEFADGSTARISSWTQADAPPL